jgi:coatomer subunit beta'
MQDLAILAKDAGRLNVAFIAYFLTGQVEQAIQMLIDGNRIPEAAFLARTYMPSQISRFVLRVPVCSLFILDCVLCSRFL